MLASPLPRCPMKFNYSTLKLLSLSLIFFRVFRETVKHLMRAFRLEYFTSFFWYLKKILRDEFFSPFHPKKKLVNFFPHSDWCCNNNEKKTSDRKNLFNENILPSAICGGENNFRLSIDWKFIAWHFFPLFIGWAFTQLLSTKKAKIRCGKIYANCCLELSII